MSDLHEALGLDGSADAGAGAPADGSDNVPADGAEVDAGLGAVSGETDPGAEAPDVGTLALDFRPDGVPDAFWDEDEQALRLGSLVKALKDTQTELRNRQPVAPEQYAVNLDEHILEEFSLGDEDPLLSGVLRWAKDTGLSQEQFDGLVQVYGQVAETALEARPTPEQLMEGIRETHGERAQTVVDSVSNFLKAALPDEERRSMAVQIALSSPAAFEMFNDFRQLLTQRTLPAPGQSPGRGTSLQQEYSRLLYSPEYAAGDRQVLRRVEQLRTQLEATEAA